MTCNMLELKIEIARQRNELSKLIYCLYELVVYNVPLCGKGSSKKYWISNVIICFYTFLWVQNTKQYLVHDWKVFSSLLPTHAQTHVLHKYKKE